MTKKTILFVAIALVLGVILGFVAGRALLERQWAKPYVQVSPSTEQRSAGGNPSPKAGTKVLAPMPIGKSREALKALTAKDPVVSNVGAVGFDEDGLELHVVVENHGPCTLNLVEGVAYGFDAYGKPARLLKGGENFMAFTARRPLEPGKKRIIQRNLKEGAEDATLAIAHIDHTTCTDGTSWTRAQ